MNHKQINYVSPKKSLGQHFLTDVNIAASIVELLHPLPNETIIEIGPGTGVLTQFIIEKPNPFIAIDIDLEAFTFLQKAYSNKKVQLENADFLTYTLPENTDTVWVGNLPYNVASSILFKMIENYRTVRHGVFMMQKEVTDRITGKEGNKEYGILSVFLGFFYHLKREMVVEPTSFNPPPKVRSAIFTLERKSEIPQVDWKLFQKVVRAAFGQRRKMLSNALKVLQLTPPIQYCNLRGEQLSVADFVLMTQYFMKNE